MTEHAGIPAPGPGEDGPGTSLGLTLIEGCGAAARPEPELIARPEAHRLDDAATARLLARLLARLPAPAPPPAASGIRVRPARGIGATPPARPDRRGPVPAASRLARQSAAPGRPADRPGRRALSARGRGRYRPGGLDHVLRADDRLDGVDAASAIADPPAHLDPQPPGEWRWMDPRTLVFTPQGERMPMATAYRVEIPAGTRSTAGATLGRDATLGFTTPPPRLVAHHPAGHHVRPDSILLLVFGHRWTRLLCSP